MSMNFQEAMKIVSATSVKKGEPAESSARSDRMNAFAAAIMGLAQGDNIGKGVNILKKSGPGYVILSAFASRSGRGGGTSNTPFLVYPSTDNSDPPFPILKVYPGKIAGIIPTLAGAKLDVLDTAPGLKPWFYPPGSPFKFFLRCKVSVDTTNLFRPSITEVKVLPDTDATVIADFEAGEIKEWKMFWDDGDTHVEGHFYIKVADIDMATVEGNQVFKDSLQWLYDSYSNVVVADTEAIPVV